jgi:fatty acid desaturase
MTYKWRVFSCIATLLISLLVVYIYFESSNVPCWVVLISFIGFLMTLIGLVSKTRYHYTLFGWNITNDVHFQYAANNPPKYLFKIGNITFARW